jgi:hypothetical protein
VKWMAVVLIRRVVIERESWLKPPASFSYARHDVLRCVGVAPRVKAGSVGVRREWPRAHGG